MVTGTVTKCVFVRQNVVKTTSCDKMSLSSHYSPKLNQQKKGKASGGMFVFLFLIPALV